jgi:hypothetical protein
MQQTEGDLCHTRHALGYTSLIFLASLFAGFAKQSRQ